MPRYSHCARLGSVSANECPTTDTQCPQKGLAGSARDTQVRREPRLGAATMFVPKRIGWAGLIVCAAGACTTEGRTAHTPVARDSAGIAILDNVGPLWDAEDRWKLSPSPTVVIGVVEGDPAYELFRTVGAVRLSDGRVVLASGGTHELRFYTPEGLHLFSVGREGGGPGEFRGIGMIARFAGDSIVVYDMMQRRVSLFDSHGVHIRDVTLTGASQVFFPMVLGRLDDGAYLAQISSRQIGPNAPELQPGEMRDSVLILHIGPDGDTFDTVGVFPSTINQVKMLSLGGNTQPLPIPVHFSPRSVVVTQPDGMIAGTSDTYDVRYYGSDGTLRRIVRKEHEPVPVTQADVDSVNARLQQSLAESNIPDELRSIYDDRPSAETMPAFLRLMTDSEGNLWVEEYRRPGDDVPRWSVFDSDGYFLGVVTGPEGIRVTDIGPDYMLGIVTDELDVERVVMYRLVRG